jgi:hypothetical protein
MDLSPFVAWSVPTAGLVIATGLGLRAADKESPAHLAAALGISIALGIALTFVQALLLTLYIDRLHLCPSRGDGNMIYWIQSFFAIPVFWLAGWAAWRVKQ